MAQASKINLKEHFKDGQLDLSEAGIQEIPVKEIANMKKATSLDLSHNSLPHLGKNFTILTNITKLDLSNNLIKELPENFGEMKQLKYLDLCKNRLKHLPLSFCELKSLRWLDVKNNPLVPALAQVANPYLETNQYQQCAIKIVAFMAQMKVEEEKQRHTAQKQKGAEKNEANATAPVIKNQQKKTKKVNKIVENPKVKVIETVSKQKVKQENKLPKIKVMKNKNVKTQEKPHPKSTFCKNLCYYIIFSILLFAFMAFLTCVFYPAVFNDIQELSLTVWDNIITRMPSSVVYYIEDYIVPIGIFIQMQFKNLSIKLFDIHENLYQNEHFKLMEDHAIEIWSNLKLKLSDLFRTYFQVNE